MMLAAEVDFGANGDTIKITGDDASDSVKVFLDDGIVKVLINDSQLFAPSNGSATLNTLNITMGDGGDTVEVDAGVVVTSETVIKLGNAAVSEMNHVILDGDHNKLTVIGGKGQDLILGTGNALASANTVIKLKGGEDFLFVELQTDYGDLDYFELLATEAPKLKINLGAGQDTFAITIGGQVASDIQLAPLVLAVTVAAAAADLAGISIPNVISLNGGGGDDFMLQFGIFETINIIGNAKSFEIIPSFPIFLA